MGKAHKKNEKHIGGSTMKRSEINKALKELEAMCEKYHCYLPPFCHYPRGMGRKGS